MRFAVELLDHIFSYLVSESDRGTLFACLKDPVLSSIADKHFFAGIIVDIHDVSRTSQNLNHFTFHPDRLSKLVAKNPLILNYVRVLQIQIGSDSSLETEAVLQLLLKFKSTLPMFSLLSSIILSSNNTWTWPLSTLLALLVDDLDLPALEELHFVGGVEYVFSVVTYIKNSSSSDPLQGKSLSLEIDLVNSPYYNCVSESGNINASSGPVSLIVKRLTIRTAIEVGYNVDSLDSWKNWLPVTALVIKSFIFSPPRHLVLDVTIALNEYVCDLAAVDFSPLAVLGAASLMIPRIDLYVHTGGRLDYNETHNGLLGSLKDCEGIMRRIEEGVLVIHSEETAPVSRRIG